MAVSASGLFRRFFGSAVSNAAGYAVGGAIQPVLEPLTQDLANEAWSTHPVKPIGATTAARAAAEGILTNGEAQAEARLTGANADRFATLRQLANDYPTTSQLLDLLNRGVVTVAQVNEAMSRNAIPAAWREALIELRTYLVPPSDLVRMAVREVFDPAKRAALDLDAEFPTAFLDRAKLIGMTPEVARDFWAAHWQLPSITEGAQMFFRGVISEAQFVELIAALDYAPVWREPLIEVSRPIPSLTDMVTMAVREVYDPAKRAALDLDAEFPEAFAQQAAMHGFSRDHAMDEWAKHWRLPSPTQAFEMFHRGVISRDELRTLLKAQDYAPVWRGPLEEIAYHVPGRIDLRRMLAAGVVDRERVKRGYQDLGYTPDDAETLTVFAEHLVAGNTTSTPWANKARSSLFTTTHTEFLDHSLDEAGVRAELDAIGIGASEQATVIDLWQRQREIRRTELTSAQVKKAYKEDRLTLDEARTHLMNLAMKGDDVDDFLMS